MAKKQNLQEISITDHCNIGAYKNLDSINTHGIKLIKGIEIDTVFNNYNLHFLLYNFNAEDNNFKKYEKKIRKNDIKNFKKTIKALEEKFSLKINRKKLNIFIKNNQYFDKVRLNNLLVNLNIIDNPSDAFYKYTKFIEEKKRTSITLKQLAKIANTSGGVIILAHPFKYEKDFIKVKDLILKIKTIIFDLGIEVFSKHQNLQQQQNLLKFTKEHTFITTGGTDTHGKIGISDKYPLGKLMTGEILKENLNVNF